MCTCKSHDTLVEEDILQKSVVSFHCVIPKNWTETVMLSDKYLYLLSHLTSPLYMLLKSVVKSGDIAQFDILAWHVWGLSFKLQLQFPVMQETTAHCSSSFCSVNIDLSSCYGHWGRFYLKSYEKKVPVSLLFVCIWQVYNVINSCQLSGFLYPERSE